MLSGQAYSFRQKARLSISLSWIGGYTNIVGLIALGNVISHVTGTSTQLAEYLGRAMIEHLRRDDFLRAAFFSYVLFSFVTGAGMSAFLSETAKRLGWRSRYMLPLAVEVVLLALVTLMMARNGYPMPVGPQNARAIGLAALAMGLQNATITRISGSVVRTTHLTGIFTDFGLESVQFLFMARDQWKRHGLGRLGRRARVAKRNPELLRLFLLVSIAGSFGFGAIIGTIVLSTHFAGWALVLPIAFLVFIIGIDWRKPIADIHEMNWESDPSLPQQAMVKNLLPVEVVFYQASDLNHRKKGYHRAPDFQMWVSRVPEHCRVIVLDISPRTRFDANAAMDLEQAVRQLRSKRKKLILSGVTVEQFKALEHLGVARVIDPRNLCTDVEFAIARAMLVLEERQSGSSRG